LPQDPKSAFSVSPVRELAQFTFRLSKSRKRRFEATNSKPDLSVQIGTQILRNPLILAPGGLGRTARGLIRFGEEGCGAVMSKTITPDPWEGNPSPRILEVGNLDLINCEGLPNLGRRVFVSEIKKAKAALKDCLIVPTFTGNTVDDFVQIAVEFEQAGADCLGVGLNGCRNFKPGTPIAASYWAQTPERIYEVIKAVREKVSIPIWVKGAQGQNLTAKVQAAEAAGADAIIARGDGTMAMPINTATGKPILGHPHAVGHLTGPFSKWDGLRVVADVSRSVKLPIIGGGGM